MMSLERVCLIATSSVVCLMLIGCGKKKEMDLPPEATKPAARIARSEPEPPAAPIPPAPALRTPQPPTAPPVAATPATDDIPIRLCALVESKSGGRAGFVNRLTGASAMLDIGERFSGYELVRVDVAENTALVGKDGKELLLKLTAAAPAPAATGPTRLSDIRMRTAARQPDGHPVPTPPQIDVSKLAPPRFEQTPAEKERGIDPNDPSTWPEGYRGPGIERAILQLPKDHRRIISPTLTSRPQTTMPPTEAEAAEGIDPNDPATWPEGYRGPGIERAITDPSLWQQHGTAPPMIVPPNMQPAPDSDLQMGQPLPQMAPPQNEAQ